MSEPTYHRDVAVQHYAAKLGASFQAIAMLQAIWSCVNDPWEAEPSVFLSSTRLAWVCDNRSSRCTLIRKLVKIGAIAKGKATRSGCKYTLQRPAIWELNSALQAAISDVSPRDYRYNENVRIVTDAEKVKPLTLPRPKQVPRKIITERLKLYTLGSGKIRASWKMLAYMIEKICGLSKGTVSYRRGRQDVHALGSWLVTAKIRPSEFNHVFKLLRVDRDDRPKGNALRYVFEADTEAKAEYLRCVLAELRPRLQTAKADET